MLHRPNTKLLKHMRKPILSLYVKQTILAQFYLCRRLRSSNTKKSEKGIFAPVV